MAKIVILGLGAAGFAAALAIRKRDRTSEVVIVDNKDYDLMHPCGLPYALGREISPGALKHSIQGDSMKIEVKNDSNVTKIDTKKKKLTINNDFEESYDKLIISTGASQILPPVPGADKCILIDNPDDIGKLSNKAKGKKAVVVGAGAIGTETAWALKSLGAKVTLIDMLPSAFPKTMDPDMSAILEEYLKNEGIDVRLDTKLLEVKDKKVLTEDGEIPASIVVAATGVKANMKLAQDAGIKCGKHGIKVNSNMETSVKDVYAAGDCAENVDIIKGQAYVCQIASAAYKQGQVAGINSSGGKAAYPGATGTFISLVGKMGVAATGYNEYYAKEQGFDIVVGKAKSLTLPDWMTGGELITVKLIADKKTKKVIGGQVVGGGALGRINTIATAIKAGFTLQDVADIELAYCPALSNVTDVLTLAAEFGLRRLK